MEDERKLYEVIARLENECTEDPQIAEIYTILDILHETEDTEEIKKCINALQRINDTLFEKYGLRESILDFQVCVNTLRSRYDIVDDSEVVERIDGAFVQ